MHTYSPRRRLALVTFVLLVAAAITIFGGGSSVATAKSNRHRHLPKSKRHHHHRPKHKRTLSGTWSGSYSGSYSGTFTLTWKQSGSNLHGSITLSNPSGTYSISGTVHGRRIKFGAVSAGATYKGSVSRDRKSMSGTYKAHTKNGKKGGGSWTANKTS